MNREIEFNRVKSIIAENFEDANCGMFFNSGCFGDKVELIFSGNYFRLYICTDYSYYELFGCSDEEKKEIEDFYDNLH